MQWLVISTFPLIPNANVNLCNFLDMIFCFTKCEFTKYENILLIERNVM